MAGIDVSKDIRSLSDFKRNTSEFVARMRECGRPVALTINGKAALVVQNAAAYQKLLDEIDHLQAVVGIACGTADAAAGRLTPIGDFVAEFSTKHRLPADAAKGC